MNQAKHIGMDVHPSTTVFAVLNTDPECCGETIVPTEARPIIDLPESLKRRYAADDASDQDPRSGRGIQTYGHGAYPPSQREHCLRQLTDGLYQELDPLRKLRKQAKRAMLTESRTHRATGLLQTIPQLGPIRCALIG